MAFAVAGAAISLPMVDRAVQMVVSIGIHHTFLFVCAVASVILVQAQTKRGLPSIKAHVSASRLCSLGELIVEAQKYT